MLGMALCETCKSVKFELLVVSCVQQWRAKRQSSAGGPDHDDGDEQHHLRAERQKHHNNITELRRCQSGTADSATPGCEVCRLILIGFEKNECCLRDRLGGDDVMASCPLVMYEDGLRVLVGLGKAGQGLIEICSFDISIDGNDVKDHKPWLHPKAGLTQCPILRKMDQDPFSERSIALASRWLQICRTDHGKKCDWHNASRYSPPRRLIDVSDASQNPILIDTSAVARRDAVDHFRWLSLSYCWGNVEPSLKLTEKTLEAMKKEIQLHTVDEAIRDAIRVTRALGIPYLWVDALCIVQDSGEWEEESTKMNDIYGGSEVTLVAASTGSVKESFLQYCQFKFNYIQIPFHVPSREINVYLSPKWDTLNDSAVKSKWSERGWTMQEGLLPSRLLYFAPSQMFWDCQQEQRFERGVTRNADAIINEALTHQDPDDFRLVFNLEIFQRFKSLGSFISVYNDPQMPEHAVKDLFDTWYELLENYTPRLFANNSDRLIALSGIAKAYGRSIRCNEYLAGLWKPDLIRGLMWYEADSLGPIDTHELERETLIPGSLGTSGPSIFPSWSWANAGYEQLHRHSKSSGGLLHPYLEFEQVEICLSDKNDPFSLVKPGSRITLRGPFKRLPRLYDLSWRDKTVHMTKLERHLSEMIQIQSQQLGNVPTRFSSPGRGTHFAILRLANSFCWWEYLLVLESAGEAVCGEKGHDVYMYRRLGILRLHHVPEEEVTPAHEVEKMERLGIIEPQSQKKILPVLEGPQVQEVFDEVIKEEWCSSSVSII